MHHLFDFSTETAGQSPLSALRGLNDRNLVFQIDPLPGRQLRAEIHVQSRPELRVMDARLSGVSHGAAPVRGGDDELLLAIPLSGTSILRQHGRELTLTSGEGLLLRRGDGPFTLTHPDAVHFLGVRIPDRAIRPLAAGLDAAAARRIPSRSGVLGLLTGYLRGAMAHRLMASAPEHAIVVSHVHDLVALIAGANGSEAALASSRGLRAARLRAITADALEHLQSPELSAAAIARRQGISARYVHRLFEEAGQTFSQFVLEQRLRRAYRMLRDPRFDTETISSIAYALGFGDLSYFNRAFRRRYGCSPSDLRREPS